MYMNEKKRTASAAHRGPEGRGQPLNYAQRNRRRIRRLAEGAIIAALYVALTWLANAVGLSGMAVQVRFSEALCVLTLFTPAAVPGLWVGCMLANLTTGAMMWDIVFGSLATLVGALGGWSLGCLSRRMKRDGHVLRAAAMKWLIPLPTVVANTVTVPLILIYAYALEGSFPLFALTVGIGELVSAWFLGLLLMFPLERKEKMIFK